jgi:hypothetical protein
VHITRRVASFRRNTQVELLAVDPSRVRVRSLDLRQVAWVPRAAVSELPKR